MKKLAKHLIAELYDCDRKILNDLPTVEKTLLKAAEAARATVVAHSFHQYAPQGVCGVVIVAESHLSIHTWPEHGYAAVDIFTSGNDTDNAAALTTVKKALKAQRIIPMELHRGFPA